MSWYTVGEIFVWMIIAAVVGGVLGWLLRGLFRPPRPSPAAEARAEARAQADADLDAAERSVSRFAPQPTQQMVVDTGDSHTGPVSIVTAQGTAVSPDAARANVRAIASRTAGDGPVPRDDLVRIHGVGPKIAAMLVSMGITSFRQVARFTPDDVAIVNAALEVFPGRIERDDWMGSARALHREVYGADPLA